MANTDFTLPATGYATFDALSMKQLIKDRLRQNAFYTDQDFEGSNLSSLIDMLAYNYHVLLFYLNQTSTESLFSESQLYENVNRIVKLLNYNPIGFQTCKLQFDLTGSSQLGTGAYAIPQYTYTTASGVQYTLVDDVFFSKTTNNIEKIGNVSSTHVLYQGIPQEYPIQSAAGEEFEMLTILPGNDVVIDHYTIRVYVKNVNTNKWSKWSQVDTLFSESQTAESYQLRLNEH